MPLSRAALRELTTELASLRERRQAIDTAIQGIEVLLTDPSNEQATPEPLNAAPSRPGRTRPIRRRGSLRMKVLGLLDRSTGLTSAQVTGRLEADGFRVSGRASLRERVSHELARLRRRGVLKKNDAGQYQVAERPASVASIERAAEFASVG